MPATDAAVPYIAFRLRDNRDAAPLLARTFAGVSGVHAVEVLPGKQAALMRVEHAALDRLKDLAKKHKCALLPLAVWRCEI